MPVLPEVPSNADQVAFVQRSEVTIIIPKRSNVKATKSDENDLSEVIREEKQRDLLFFDEIVPVLVVVQSTVPREDFETLLEDLHVTVTAHATSAAPPPGKQENGASSEPKAILDSQTLTPENGPIVGYGLKGSDVLTATWMLDLHLHLPEQQLHRPVLHFTASASFRTGGTQIKYDPDDEYMSSAVPNTENLIQTLQGSPDFTGVDITLPAARIQKVIPRSATAMEETRPIRGISKQFPIAPALVIRTNISRVTDASLVSLDVEISRWVNCDVRIEKVTGWSLDIEVSPLASTVLPTTVRSGDRTSFVFRQDIIKADGLQTSADKTLQLHVEAQAFVNETCRPRLHLIRNTSPQLSPVHQHGRSIKHWQHQRQSMQPVRPTSMMTPGSSMVFTFHGPDHIDEGSAFHIDVFVINCGSKKRRLALVAVPQRQRLSSPSPHRQGQSTAQMDKVKAQAVITDSIMTKTGGSSKPYAEIVSLSADVKIGPLLPGACHNTSLDFLALSTGVVGLESVSVVDVDTKETVHVVELPEIVAYERME